MVRIPTSALVFREDGMQVAVLGPSDRVELRHVTLGRISGGRRGPERASPRMTA